jgi:hypothetical protein
MQTVGDVPSLIIQIESVMLNLNLLIQQEEMVVWQEMNYHVDKHILYAIKHRHCHALLMS